MVMPPIDLGPHEVWDNGPLDDDVRDQVREFACWINYLMNPDQHDGPRRYACRGAAEGGCGVDCGYHFDSASKLEPQDLKQHVHHADNADGSVGPPLYSSSWDLQPVLQGVEPSTLFYAIHAFSGIRWSPPSNMETAFQNLKDSYLCSAEKKLSPKTSELYYHDATFDDFEARMKTVQGMGEADPRYKSALSYQASALKYAESHENQMFVLAEALGRYRGLYLGARDKILLLMKRMTETFDKKVHLEPEESLTEGEIAGALLSAALGAVFAAATGGTGAMAYGAITGAIGSLIVGEITEDEAGNLYRPGQPQHPPTHSLYWLGLIDWYVQQVNQIGDEAFHALDINNPESLIHKVGRQLTSVKNETAAEPPAPPAFCA